MTLCMYKAHVFHIQQRVNEILVKTSIFKLNFAVREKQHRTQSVLEIKSAQFLLLYCGILFFDPKCKYVNRCHVSRNSDGGQQEGKDAVTDTRWCKKSVEEAPNPCPVGALGCSFCSFQQQLMSHKTY